MGAPLCPSQVRTSGSRPSHESFSLSLSNTPDLGTASACWLEAADIQSLRENTAHRETTVTVTSRISPDVCVHFDATVPKANLNRRSRLSKPRVLLSDRAQLSLDTPHRPELLALVLRACGPQQTAPCLAGSGQGPPCCRGQPWPERPGLFLGAGALAVGFVVPPRGPGHGRPHEHPHPARVHQSAERSLVESRAPPGNFH